jgi:integrase
VPSRVTVEQAAWLWLEGVWSGRVRDRSGHRYKPGTLREYRRVLCLRVLPEFASVGLAELTRPDIQRFVDGLLGEGLAASTIRNTVNPPQAIYRYAVRRERVATGVEAARLLDALPDSDRPIWAAAFYAGLRRGELQALRRSDIDLGRAEISVIVPGISTRDRSRPSQRPALAPCRSLECCASALICAPSQRARIWSSSETGEEVHATRRRLTTGRSVHVRRPTSTRSRLLSARSASPNCSSRSLSTRAVTPKAIQEFMGHATIEETFSRYGHLMPGTRNQARELVDAYMSAVAA